MKGKKNKDFNPFWVYFCGTRIVQFGYFLCSCPVFQTLFIEGIIVSHWIFLPPLSQINYLCKWISFLALYSDSLIYMSVFMPVPHYFAYCSFVVYFEIRAYDTFSFVLQIFFGYLWYFVFPQKF